MADFSIEYSETTGIVGVSSFSIKDTFESLEDGYMVSQICEGFGFLAISNINGECNVLVYDGDVTVWKVFDFSTNAITQ